MIILEHEPLSETALKACYRFVPYIDEHFEKYDYSKPTVEKARLRMDRLDNITGHQQRCFMTYWGAWCGDRGGVALDIGGAGVRHPYTLHSDILRGHQPNYGGKGEVWPDLQFAGEDVSMFGDECFEGIINSHLIEHLRIPAYEALVRWRRIVRSEGIIAGILPDGAFVDVMRIDVDHKQEWSAKNFYAKVLTPLEKEGLFKILEFDTFENAFSFNFVIVRT